MCRFLHCLVVRGLVGLVIVLSASVASAEAPKLAHFRFDGNANDENPAKPAFELAETQFTQQGLYLNGNYQFGPSGGFRAVCQTPDLHYSAFSVVLRCKPDEFAPGKTNLLTGGTSYRWFGLQRSVGGNLMITLNNQTFSQDIQGAPLTSGQWMLVACSVNLDRGTVVVYFNGKKAADVELPKDFKLLVNDSDAKDRDKVWTFANYSNGNVFHGSVDELIIYGQALSNDELKAFKTVAPDLASRSGRRKLVQSAVDALGARLLGKGYKSSWSPDARQILVSVPNGGVDRIDVKSLSVSRLVELGKDPAWSPSGKVVAYVRGDAAQEEIWLVDADGGNNQKLADGGFPTWSVDGNTLYFHSRSDWQIKSVDLSAAEREFKNVLLVKESWYPVVSPDGQRVAYVSQGNLVVVALKTNERITRALAGAQSGLAGWSPDSKQVGYAGYGGSDNAGLWLLDLQSGKVKRIAAGPYTMPVWSADGKWLAFDLRSSGRAEVWAIDAAKLKNLPDVDMPEDRYVVPDGDVEALLAFIRNLREFRPRTAQEMMLHRNKGPAAIAAAAEKILALGPAPESAAHATARLAILEPRLTRLSALPKADRDTLVEELETALKEKSKHGLEQSDVVVVANAAQMLEYGDNPQLSADALKRLAAVIATAKPFAAYATALEGTARRLGLVGNDLELSGKTVAGEEFDWSSYRGKVVLIDFWATWCGPCVAELPNVKSLYAKYRDRGFDVVGISLDRDRAALDKFIAEKQLPWTTLHDSDGTHPAAAHYGVSAIPTMLLVGRDGKVVSIRARGEELNRLLADLIGPANDQKPN